MEGPPVMICSMVSGNILQCLQRSLHTVPWIWKLNQLILYSMPGPVPLQVKLLSLAQGEHFVTNEMNQQQVLPLILAINHATPYSSTVLHNLKV